MELRVKDIAKKNGVQIQDIYPVLGISKQAYCRRVKFGFEVNQLEPLAVALKCTVHELLPLPDGFMFMYDENGKFAGIHKK